MNARKAMRMAMATSGLSFPKLKLAMGKGNPSNLIVEENPQTVGFVRLVSTCGWGLYVRSPEIEIPCTHIDGGEPGKMQIGRAIKVMIALSDKSYMQLCDELDYTSTSQITNSIGRNNIYTNKLIKLSAACGFDVILKDNKTGDEIKLTIDDPTEETEC